MSDIVTVINRYYQDIYSVEQQWLVQSMQSMKVRPLIPALTFYSEFALSVAAQYFSWYSCFFTSTVQKNMHAGRMHFFKTSCFTDYNHFRVVRHFGLLSFFAL